MRSLTRPSDDPVEPAGLEGVLELPNPLLVLALSLNCNPRLHELTVEVSFPKHGPECPPEGRNLQQVAEGLSTHSLYQLFHCWLRVNLFRRVMLPQVVQDYPLKGLQEILCLVRGLNCLPWDLMWGPREIMGHAHDSTRLHLSLWRPSRGCLGGFPLILGRGVVVRVTERVEWLDLDHVLIR